MPPFTINPTTKPASDQKLVWDGLADGDTARIEQPVRFVSCDTPEKSRSQAIAVCAERLRSGFFDGAMPDQLRDHLLSRLKPEPEAAMEAHKAAGLRAKAILEALRDTRLVKDDGTPRKVATIPTGEVIDRYGRMLAYLAPWYDGGPDDPLPPREDPRRATFNLNMIELGWAVFFPIWPSLPGPVDFDMTLAAARIAWDEKRGMWDEFGPDLLLPYEYRACQKLGATGTPADLVRRAFQRICVDMRDQRVVGRYGFHAIPPSERFWIWEDDFYVAAADLGLPPVPGL